VYKLRKI